MSGIAIFNIKKFSQPRPRFGQNLTLWGKFWRTWVNPLRAGLVMDLDALSKFAFSGHGVIMGKLQQSWQSSKQVLVRFDKRIKAARIQYEAFVAEGADQGRRADLTGGGLIRSTGGWQAVQAMRKANVHVKSDERILGDGDFVAQILKQANEDLKRKYALKADGMDVQRIAKRVAELFNMPVESIWLEGRYRSLVTARSLLCFWAVRELGVSMASLARKLNISTVAVSKSVKRGAEIASKQGYKLDIVNKLRSPSPRYY